MVKTPHNFTYRKAKFKRFDFDPAEQPSQDTLYVSKMYVLDIEIKDTNKKQVIQKLKDIISEIENGVYEDEKVYKQNYERKQMGRMMYNLYEFENFNMDKDEWHGYDD